MSIDNCMYCCKKKREIKVKFLLVLNNILSGFINSDQQNQNLMIILLGSYPLNNSKPFKKWERTQTLFSGINISIWRSLYVNHINDIFQKDNNCFKTRGKVNSRVHNLCPRYQSLNEQSSTQLVSTLEQKWQVEYTTCVHDTRVKIISRVHHLYPRQRKS